MAGLDALDPCAAQAVGLPSDRLWADPRPGAVETRADLSRMALADLHATGL